VGRQQEQAVVVGDRLTEQHDAPEREARHEAQAREPVDERVGSCERT
jgi:hypothetical protein